MMSGGHCQCERDKVEGTGSGCGENGPWARSFPGLD
jgi:hypothetical protein